MLTEYHRYLLDHLKTDHNLDFLKACESQLPEGKKFAYLRADATSYQAALFNYCNKNDITYTIGGHLDQSVLNTIAQISQWKPLSDKKGTVHYLKEEVAEFLPTSHFQANALYFHIGTLAYNLLRILHTSWQKHTILKVNQHFVEMIMP